MNPTPRTEDAKHRYWMGGHWSDKFFRFAQVLESENITLEARIAEMEKRVAELETRNKELADQEGRRFGRMEAARALMNHDPEDLDDLIGSHTIGDTGDYGLHWIKEAVLSLFDIESESATLEYLDGEHIRLWHENHELEKDKERLDWLTNEVGDTRQATDSTVRIFQDDATHDFFVNDHFGRSIRQAIDTAMKGGSK